MSEGVLFLQKMYLLVHEIFAAKEQQDVKMWLNIIKLSTQWSGAYFLEIVAIFCFCKLPNVNSNLV